MELIIANPQQIADELAVIDSFLDITPSEEIEEAVLRGNYLSTYIARSGKLLDDAKYWLNEKMKSEVIETLKIQARQAGASAKAINAIIDSLCKEERFLVDWADRANASATHQLDWCRTLISKAKEEMRLAGWQRT